MRERARHATLIGVGTIAQVVLDARAGVSGSPVDTWTGRPGTSINATGSGSARPTTTTLNGQPALLFDGTDDLLTMSAGALSVFQNSSHNRLICVGLTNGSGDSEQAAIFFSTGSGATFARCALYLRFTSANNVRLGARRLDADGFTASSTVGSTGTAGIAEGVFNWSSNSFNALQNGLAGSSSTFPSGAGNTSNTASLGAFIGWNTSAGSNRLNGPIAAVIATNQAWSTSLASLVRLCLSRSFLIPLAA